MRTSRFSLDEIGEALKQAGQGVPVPDVAARLGVSQQTVYRWKKLYSGLPPGQAHIVKTLREENARLKREVVELKQDRQLLQEIATKKW